MISRKLFLCLSSIRYSLMNKGKENVNRQVSDYDHEMKDKFLHMPIEEKRTHYKCSKNYVTVDSIDKVNDQIKEIAKKMVKNDDTKVPDVTKLSVEEAEFCGDKISIWQGDITRLEVDSIVNAANETLLGGGGVDGAIHAGAGKLLVAECKTLNGCKTGEAKITGGYLLPAKYVIHTVGPIGEIPDKLKSAYNSCLEVMKANNLSTIAFPCISTGVYGYPKEAAAKIAMKTVLNFLRTDYGKNVNRIIFSLHLDKDVALYEKLVRAYFESLI